MKNLLFIITFSLFILNNLYSEEVIDCNQFDKLSAKFLECKAQNLKSDLNKSQAKAKENIKSKIKTLDSSKAKKKFDKSKLKKILVKIKNSKTGSKILKKE